MKLKHLVACSAAIVLAACSTNFDTSEVKNTTGKKIYTVEQARAFQIAHDSIATVLPGRKISKVDGPTKGYSTYSRFMLDTYTQQVLVIPLKGKTRDGKTVEGFNLNVSGSGTSIVFGRSKNVALFEEVENRLSGFQSAIAVSDVQRRSYDTPVFGQGTAAPAEQQNGSPSAEARLERLKDLKEQGLITDDEYREKRQQIIDSI